MKTIVNRLESRGAAPFGSWGPKLLTLALGALAIAVDTASVSAEPDRARPSCTLSTAAPRLAASQPAFWPTNETTSNGSGLARVRVDLDEHAGVRNATIVKSSGDFWLDKEARRLAREARFEMADGGTCMAPESYGIEFEFVE